MSTRNPAKRVAAQRKPPYTREEFTAWLGASCERNGVPPTVTDPIAIAQVAALLGQHPQRRPLPRGRRGRVGGRSNTPDGLDPNGIHGARAGASDDRVNQDRANDSVPGGPAHVGPWAA